MRCLSNKRADWSQRLNDELKVQNSAVFITLTYSDDNVPLDKKSGLKTLKKDDYQKFMKKLRKKLENVSIKYFAVGEYGEETERPHYHAIVYGLPYKDEALYKLILETWREPKEKKSLGMIHIGECNEKTIKYCTKYIIQKAGEFEGREKPFALMSKKLGASYIDGKKSWHKKDVERNYVIKPDGKYGRLPRYYREKIYTKLEKQIQNEKTIKRISEDDSLEVYYRKNPTGNYFGDEAERNAKYDRRIRETIKNKSKI